MGSQVYTVEVDEVDVNNIKHCMFCGSATTNLHLEFKKIYLIECSNCSKTMSLYCNNKNSFKQENEEILKLNNIIHETYRELRYPDPEFSTYKACAILKKAIPIQKRIEITKGNEKTEKLRGW